MPLGLDLYGIFPYILLMKPAKKRSAALKSRKSGRIEARVTPENRATIDRAASLTGRSVTDFVVSSSLDAANRVIRAQERIALSEADRKVFFAALAAPPAPNKAALRAAREYLTRIGE